MKFSVQERIAAGPDHGWQSVCELESIHRHIPVPCRVCGIRHAGFSGGRMRSPWSGENHCSNHSGLDSSG
jgi:hypothetical protein